eukprot:scaffold10381_cov144-Skeletonema_dohrnii-CCMP3373.AAC.1
MSYPKENPKLKHDLLCPSSIIGSVLNGSTNDESVTAIETVDALTSSVVKSAIPMPSLPADINKLATIYTYSDAPTVPKPLSSAPRIWKLVKRDLFDACCGPATVGTNNNRSKPPLQKCTVAVKLPQHIHGTDPKSQKDLKNSKLFSKFVSHLHNNELVAMTACDSAGRIGFIVPLKLVEGYFAAELYYAPMKAFIPWARENHTKSQQQQQQTNVDEEEPQTWTPQYTPPPMDDDRYDDEVMETWTPQYTPPPESECGVPRGWTPTRENGKTEEDDSAGLFKPPGTEDDTVGLFKPPGAEDDTAGLFKPPGTDDDTAGLFKPPESSNDNDGWNTTNEGWDFSGGWDNNDATTGNNDASNADNGIGAWTSVPQQANKNNEVKMKEGTFHANAGAAAADAFYSGLTRTLDTRADSRLYHMRAFNGWVKATQIAELDPDISFAANNGKKRSRRAPLRVLDLACGKGGDLGKWTLHQRGVENYVGVDVARGSLIDAAIRARTMSKRKTCKLRKCTFTLADLGEDVPGRKRSENANKMQKLLTWTMQNETNAEKEVDPKFVALEGGGIAETDKFDVVSIQFAIHYMMQTRKRARRFFHTVSSLLEIGGNLIATTIDARVVIEKLMALGLDLHFDEMDQHEEVDKSSNEAIHHNGNKRRKVNDENEVTVKVGNGVCRLKFDPAVVRKVFEPSNSIEEMFGLQYTFTLVEGSDHAAGVGEAVDLPEWLTPIPALEELAEEAGLKMEYASNFHSFYQERKDPAKFPAAHNALYNMKVLNRNGSISEQEWNVSRMYVAIKFRKVRESSIHIGDEDVGEDELLCDNFRVK